MPKWIETLLFGRLLSEIDGLRNQIQEIEKTMITKAQLDEALGRVFDETTRISDQLTQLGTDFDKAVADLKSKITAATSAEDLQAEFDQLETISGKLETVSDGLAALDTRAKDATTEDHAAATGAIAAEDEPAAPTGEQASE